jgi:hypothetical protein
LQSIHHLTSLSLILQQEHPSIQQFLSPSPNYNWV